MNRCRRRLLIVSYILLAASAVNFIKTYSRFLQGLSNNKGITSQRKQRNGNVISVLYTVTSMNEFDTGRRATLKGYDRFSNTIVPIMKESAVSMEKAGFEVTVQLITHYKVKDHRKEELLGALQPHITGGIMIWDEATPIGYAVVEKATKRVQEITRALARQHRYVIKDRFLEHDLFVNFEDDMVIKGVHLQQYWAMTNRIYDLRFSAPTFLEGVSTTQRALAQFHGPMTRTQLSRLIPGFLRVEVAIKGKNPVEKEAFPQIPVSFEWNKTISEAHVDPDICCRVSKETVSEQIPERPTSHNDLLFWETAIDALGIRKLPTREWVLLLGGSIDVWYPKPMFIVGDYWSGQDHGYFGNMSRPDKTKSRYMSNQGGWMATRRQIKEWNLQWCRGGFLPPFREADMPASGLATRTVEFWSGSGQLAGVKSCNLQRVVSLAPDEFSRHLLYHASNNKQLASTVRHKFTSRSIDVFWGQLNTIRKNAEERIQQEANTKSEEE